MTTPTAPSAPPPAGPPGWSLAISDALLVDDLVRLAPSSLAVLSGRGLDPSRDGQRTLADLARRHQVALDALLDALRDDAAEGAAHAVR